MKISHFRLRACAPMLLLTLTAACSHRPAPVVQNQTAVPAPAVDPSKLGLTANLSAEQAQNIGALIGAAQGANAALAAAPPTANKTATANAGAAAGATSGAAAAVAAQQAGQSSTVVAQQAQIQGNQAGTQAGQTQPSGGDTLTFATSGPVAMGPAAVLGKVQLTDNEDVAAGGSIGYFIGYDIFGSRKFYPMIFAGFSSVSLTVDNTTTSNSSSSTTKQNQTAISFDYGIGFTFNIYALADDDTGKTVLPHVGLVIGFDHTAINNKYQYNDKPWLGLIAALDY